MKKILLLIMILLLTACGNAEKQSDKPQVYTSFYAMYDFTRTIGGEDIDLYNIVPTGAEPHDFEPSASDMAKLSESDVFIYSGGGMESWAEDIVETLPENVAVICTSEGIEIEHDPHIWLSFDNVKKQLTAISKQLSQTDSANAQRYADRLASYTAQINELETEYKNAELEGKKIFVTHGAYGYLCGDFGMEQIALEGISGHSDPTPAQMASVVDQIKAEGAKCIFYDPLEGDKMANAVAEEAGIEALPLYTFEGDSEGRDYLAVMKLNLEQLKKAL